ncbi:MAG: NADH-quinone oxidoreductase subunit J [Myxococcales bacterium]|nr:NADH-quinone oxidoreductase subunit J [Myxococcales bacterium]
MFEAVLFYLFSLVAIVSGVGVVTMRNPIASALSLVVCFFFLAADYVLLDAHFVAVIQILVYAGAIMVLFVFVIMLLNLRHGDHLSFEDIGRRSVVGMGTAGLLAIGLFTALGQLPEILPAAIPADYGTIAYIGRALFEGPYLLPFEAVSALLTVAVVGAVVLAKKEI